MGEEYQIVYRDEPEWAIIGGGERDFNMGQTGEDKYKSLCFVLLAPDQEIVGDVIGATYWDWFNLDLLWVKEEFRRRGFGSRLLTSAENRARQHGAKNVFLDTFSFQAPASYKQHGYKCLANYKISRRGIDAIIYQNSSKKYAIPPWSDREPTFSNVI